MISRRILKTRINNLWIGISREFLKKLLLKPADPIDNKGGTKFLVPRNPQGENWRSQEIQQTEPGNWFCHIRQTKFLNSGHFKLPETR